MNLLINCDEYGNYYHLLKYLKRGGNGGPQIEQFHSIAVSNIKSIFYLSHYYRFKHLNFE